MSRKVFVSNIPVSACVDGWVEIPDGVDEDHLDKAIAASLKENGFIPETKTVSVQIPDEMNVDCNVLDKWEFSTPLEPR